MTTYAIAVTDEQDRPCARAADLPDPGRLALVGGREIAARTRRSVRRRTSTLSVAPGTPWAISTARTLTGTEPESRPG